MIYFILLCISIFLFYKIYRIQLFEPVSILILFSFFLPFVFYPILKSLTYDTLDQSLEYFHEMQETLLIVFVVFIFWALGIGTVRKRKSFKINQPFNYKIRDRHFALILYVAGVALFFLTFFMAGLNFFTSFQDPLQTRYQIINTTGGYHLRNFALWSMWTGWFLLLCLKIQGYKVSILKLFFLFGFVIFLSLPLGQRYQLVFPFVFLLLILKYCNKVSNKMIYTSGIVMIVLLPIFALYRELGRSESGMNIDDFFTNLGVLFEQRSTILSVLSERFENIAWFNKFWIVRNELSMSFIESISGLISLFLPASFTGGVKGADMEVYLTMKIVGSQDFGTFSFTSFPEWYLNFGYLGFPLMAYISGLVVSQLGRSVKEIGNSIFCLALFADGFFMKIPFINFNFNSNVSIVYHLIFAAIVSLLYKVYQTCYKHISKKNELVLKISS